VPNIYVVFILIGLLLGRDLAEGAAGGARFALEQYAGVWLWMALVSSVALIALPACSRAAAQAGSWRLLQRGLGLAQMLRWLAVVPFAAWSMTVDGVGVVESLIGSWVGLDEGLAAMPPLVALLAISWAEFPLHDRMRQATMMRQLDEGGLLERPPTRAESLVSTTRAMLAMPLVPVWLIVCWHEAIALMLANRAPWVMHATDVAGTIAIVALAPAIIVRVLGTQPLRAGPLRDRVDTLCDHIGARVRGIRLWSHPSANAAILGILPLARYMLITEPLLRGMPRYELDAVLAHELAHVRQHHVLWIVLAMAALLLSLSLVQPMVLSAIEAMVGPWLFLEWSSIALLFALAVGCFGMVSRLIERHADARAAVAIGQEIAQARGEADGRVHPAGPASMSAALDRVCALNNVDPGRWGFRHGSVLQRQRALARISGQPEDRLPIDRQVATLRRVTIIVLLANIALVATAFLLGWFDPATLP
jgi:Zn-dependent protease with chaperone function